MTRNWPQPFILRRNGASSPPSWPISCPAMTKPSSYPTRVPLAWPMRLSQFNSGVGSSEASKYDSETNGVGWLSAKRSFPRSSTADEKDGVCRLDLKMGRFGSVLDPAVDRWFCWADESLLKKKNKPHSRIPRKILIGAFDALCEFTTVGPQSCLVFESTHSGEDSKRHSLSNRHR